MTKELTVEGMSCEGCEKAVEDSLESVAGVESATADNKANNVIVEGTADTDTLVTAIEDAGYSVTS